jgi:hypothetical protein
MYFNEGEPEADQEPDIDSLPIHFWL